tara:strand:- start:12199 stop:12786 length:588 start_codon:yes stop_codon:yes gene_type:complete
MLKIGLTGGIGSGKTTVAKVFEHLGVPVFYADLEAKKCMQSDPTLIKQLKATFGNDIYIDKKLQKDRLASIIFNDNTALHTINRLVHPAVQKVFKDWCLTQNTYYVLKEAAILFESGSDKELDQIVCVSAKNDLRKKRIMQRDNVTESQVLERMSKQWHQSRKIALADFHISNDEKQLLIPQVLEVHALILKQSV